MCTVTFIPTKKGIAITSNRDEHLSRGKATAPIKTASKTIELIYPKDPDAGGTWIATKNNGDTIVLLNGAFEKHISQSPYAKSRGLILLEIFNLENFTQSIHQFDLTNIEPFTIVYYLNNQLFEFRWNSKERFLRELDIHHSYIWSSATLYNTEISNKRKEWFKQWQLRNLSPSQYEIIHFHLTAGDGDAYDNLKMNRDNQLFTVSISSILIGKNYSDFIYVDFYGNKTTNERIFKINNATSVEL